MLNSFKSRTFEHNRKILNWINSFSRRIPFFYFTTFSKIFWSTTFHQNSVIHNTVLMSKWLCHLENELDRELEIFLIRALIFQKTNENIQWNHNQAAEKTLLKRFSMTTTELSQETVRRCRRYHDNQHLKMTGIGKLWRVRTDSNRLALRVTSNLIGWWNRSNDQSCLRADHPHNADYQIIFDNTSCIS